MSNCISNFWNAVDYNNKATAIEVDDTTYSYQDLADRSNSIRRIIEANSRSKIVAVMAYKDVLIYGAIIGTLSSGKAYCPIGEKLPLKHQLTILKETSADTLVLPLATLFKSVDLLKLLNKLKQNFTIITDKSLPRSLKNVYVHLNFQSLDILKFHQKENICPVDEGSLAYLLFTSGTTGKPKGVPITHKCLNAYLKNIEKRIDFEKGMKFSQVFPLTFDLSVHDIFVCWRHFGCLVPVPDKIMFSPAKFINEKKIQIWFSVPSQVSLIDRLGLLNAGSFPYIRKSLFCGEALPLDLAKKWMAAAIHSDVFNLYGPTEATIAVSSYKLPKKKDKIRSMGGIVSIGQLFDDHEFKTSDRELIVIGDQISGGYWKSINNKLSPFSYHNGKKSYQTGDLVEVHKDYIFYLSRLDNQVKINGARIELEEINTAVRKLINNSEVHTVNINEGFGDTLHVCVATKEIFNSADILKKLKTELPTYVIPKSIQKVGHLPLNQNGKVDSKKVRDLILNAI